MRLLVPAILMSLLCVAPALADEAPPGGVYKLDPAHTSIIFQIDHLGFSHFMGRFDQTEGAFTYDGKSPINSKLDVTIYPNSVDTHDADLDEDLRGDNWFNTVKFSTATFRTTDIEPIGDDAAKVTGDFTLHGVTHTLVLNVTKIGSGTMPFTGAHVIGFHATGKFHRSDYGMSNMEPMVGDDVTLYIDSEFDKEK